MRSGIRLLIALLTLVQRATDTYSSAKYSSTNSGANGAKWH